MIREALVLPRFLARITDFSAKTNAWEGFGPSGERKTIAPSKPPLLRGGGASRRDAEEG